MDVQSESCSDSDPIQMNNQSRIRNASPIGGPLKQKKKSKRGGKILAPVAQNQSARSKSRGQQTITHKECERVDTIVGSVNFASVGNYAINPGLASSFPWLSGVAQHFERYRMDSFKVRYKNLKGTSSAGNILMSFDYDTLDAGPNTAVIQTQSTVYVDGAPWRIFEMNVPTDGSKKYIRSSAIAGADLKTYDFGRVWVSAEGCADTSDHGYLEFEYSVTLFEKQTSSSVGSTPTNNSVAVWNLSADTAALAASAVIEITEEATTISGLSITNASGVITLPQGVWLCTAEAYWTGGGTSGAGSGIEFRVDSASIVPPVKCVPYTASGQNSNGSITCLVISDGTTTLDLYFNYGTPTCAFKQDGCRIIIQAIA